MRCATPSFVAGLLGLGGALASCCATAICDACAPGAGDVVLQFNTDSATQRGYRVTELRSLYVVRYQRPGFGTPRDTLRRVVIRAPSQYYPGALSLQQLPWPAGTGALTASNYRVVVPAAGRQHDISDLEISTNTGSGCCACEYNVRRRLAVDGRPVEADGNDSAVAVLGK